jgi:2-dehydropantoate 2-reductase
MRILVVGAGSVGGYFGGRLAQAGRDVSFLVRPARAAALREHGLRIVSPHGDATLRPRLLLAEELRGTFDAVLLTVKAFALDAALEDLASAVGPETMILPVLNGMGHVPVIQRRFGERALAGCACKVATILDKEGRVVQLTKLQDIAYGEMDGSLTARIRALDAAMQGAGFDARLSDDIAREMWEKWILLASVGGLTCLMRGALGEIEAAPGGRDVVLAFFEEVVRIVAAVGVPPSEGFLAGARGLLTQKGSTQTSSMYRDLLQGAPLEAEAIIGDLAARARQAGVPAPLVSAAHTHLGLYQNRLAAAPAQAAA